MSKETPLSTYISKEEKKKFFKKNAPDFVIIHSNEDMEHLIEHEAGAAVLQFIKKQIPTINEKVYVAATATCFNVMRVPDDKYKHLINLKRINDFRFVNKFFEAVNVKLPVGGCYIDFVDTFATRRKRLLKKFFFPFNWLYYGADVLFFRVFPKLPLLKKVYFFITRGKSRIITRAETFGRLYSCGFEIADEVTINNKLYFVARKIKEPLYDMQASYGPLVRLKRVGKNERIFNVYKFRTMHAYSEYLQDYVYEKSKLQEGGKFKNDFRVTPLGSIFRKFWLDELPMLINLLKGDLKLVGVRPLSAHYFNLYTEELQQKRTQSKPGLLPPFYADMPKNLTEIMASEIRYLDAYKKNPIKTDVSYFFKIVSNIIFRKARSS